MHILSARPLADHAVILTLATTPGGAATRQVNAAARAISRAIAAGLLPGVDEAAAAFTSLTVTYDCLHLSQTDLIARLEEILAPVEAEDSSTGRLWQLPCAYDEGLDLPDLSAALALPEAEIIARHAATEFQVLALGFLPGLPFLGELPADLARPRRTAPRVKVPKGAVAIANRQCVIYPWESPGGWHIVGFCPVPLFDPARDPPALLASGDRVRFVPVAAGEAAELATTPADPRRFLVQG